MKIIIDFNSEEALYIQLRNQIIMGIATSQLKEGEALPSVRVMAEDIGINMHTVNKAYTTLRQDGFLRVDRRRGAVICVDTDKRQDLEYLKDQMKPLVARAVVEGITRDEMIDTVLSLYDDMEDKNKNPEE